MGLIIKGPHPKGFPNIFPMMTGSVIQSIVPIHDKSTHDTQVGW